MSVESLLDAGLTPSAHQDSGTERMTRLLSPASATRLAWARSGELVDDEQSKLLLRSIDSILEGVKTRAETDETERGYLLNVLAAMESSLRSLEIIHKGRTLNFEETDRLRDAYLQSVEETIDFGNKLSDFVRSLPTMVLTGAGGAAAATLLEAPEGPLVWGIGLVCALTGFLLKIPFVRLHGKKIRQSYIQEDYQRDLYYEHYLRRASEALSALLEELNGIHVRAFGVPYPEAESSEQVITEILSGVAPTFCPLLHKHMREGKVTPELWPLCETGHRPAISECKHWPTRARSRKPVAIREESSSCTIRLP